MSNMIGSAADITMTLLNRSSLPESVTKATLSPGKSPAGDTRTTGEAAAEEAKAREAANKFESLLIHNMLKSMRKTTMSENKSNDRAIYDDMLDEKLADTMMEAGGIGIADQIVSQIKQQRATNTDSADTRSDAVRLQELAKYIQRPAGSDNNTLPSSITEKLDDASSVSDMSVTANPAGISGQTNVSGLTTSAGHLNLAAGLWSNTRNNNLSTQQYEFVQPLIPHARRNAQKLGTSPNAILAIAALESGWGQSMIRHENGNNSHNLFGIKATTSDNRYATTLTTEYIEGGPQKMQARFKTYNSEADAVNGFADFILSNPRYSNALQHAADPERFLQELQSAGYATDPRYAEKAISIMRQIAGNSPPL